ncbi:MAG: transcriptional regulator [Candidatus Marinimicrobia bacterium]|nr:transcriptional regulator [Candidatus Neomarinimicrobiota bacterium]
MKPKVKKLYYSIGEVSILTKLKPYVLRYWETEFSQLKPPKNRAGNRTYRQKDIEIILKIKDLLYNKKFTINGARSNLSKKINTSDLEENNLTKKNKELLSLLERKLKDILDIINN